MSGVVAASMGFIYNLRDKFKDTPKDIKSLMEQVQAFFGLLKELEARVQDCQNIVPLQQTLKVLAEAIAQLQKDVNDLHTVPSSLIVSE